MSYDYGVLFQSSYLLAHHLFGSAEPLILTTTGRHIWADNQDYFQLLFAVTHFLPQPHYWLLFMHALGIFACGLIAYVALRGRGFIAIAIPTMIWLSPFLLNMNIDLFHTEAYAAPLLLLTYLAAKKKKTFIFLVLLVLALSCKEDVAITAGILCFIVLLRPNLFAIRRATAAWGFVLCVGVFFANLLIVLPHFKAVTCLWLGYAPAEFTVDATPTAPWFRNASQDLFKLDFYQRVFFRREVSTYLALLLWPLIVTLRRPTLFLLLPFGGALVNIIAGTGYLIQGFYHYDHSSFAAVIIVLLESIPHLRNPRLVAISLGLAALLINQYGGQQMRFRLEDLWRDTFWDITKSEKTVVVEQLNATLPRNITISADHTSLNYLLSGRRHAYMFPNPFRISYFGVYGVCERFKDIQPPIVDVIVVRKDEGEHRQMEGWLLKNYSRQRISLGSEDFYFDIFINTATDKYGEIAEAVKSTQLLTSDRQV